MVKGKICSTIKKSQNIMNIIAVCIAITFLSTNWQKKYSPIQWTAKYVFSLSSYKSSCFMELGVQLQCPCGNDLQLLKVYCYCLHSLCTEIYNDWFTFYLKSSNRWIWKLSSSIKLCCSCEITQNILPLQNPKAEFNFGKPL